MKVKLNIKPTVPAGKTCYYGVKKACSFLREEVVDIPYSSRHTECRLFLVRLRVEAKAELPLTGARAYKCEQCAEAIHRAQEAANG